MSLRLCLSIVAIIIFLTVIFLLPWQHSGVRQKCSKEFRQQTLPTLQSLGIEKVVGGYSGYGDSGDLHDIDCLGSDGKSVKIDDLLRRKCVDFLYEFLPDGYEINDGGQGTVTLNLQAMRIELEHEQNYTDTKSSYEEYDF